MSKHAPRIPFEEAIEEKILLKNRFQDLSFPQKVALKILYGVPLKGRIVNPLNGFSELDYWAIFHDACELDELGFPKKVHQELAPEYTPKEYREAWLIFGRRAGKTDAFSSTIVAYEATLGGHEAFLRPRQQGICFQIAQDLRMARNSLHFIRAVFESSPLLEKEIVQVTADRIDLKNRFTIACVPASLKSTRGFASPISVMDEVGVWYQESESANPDYEIYRALSPGQIQFPNRKIVGISSPWNKAGLLYQYYESGTDGWKVPIEAMREQARDVAVLHGPTAVMGNPQVTREFLAKEKQRNELAFEREILAQFQDSISGFIPSVLVQEAVDLGILERPYVFGTNYFCAIDPAFKRDSFGFTIVHNENGKIIQDVVRRFTGTVSTPLNPAAVLDVILPLAKTYGCQVLYTDQYQFESFRQMAEERGFALFPVPFTAKSKSELYGNLQGLFLQRKIRLLDDYETIKEVKSLERKLTEGGSVQIAAPSGQHDDMATVLVIAVSQAMYDLGQGTETAAAGPKKDPIVQQIEEQIRKRWEMQQTWEGSWD
jgi:hypothetical protein